MNPEFRRYTWLELSPFSLLLVPGVLALGLLLTSTAANPAKKIADGALIVMGLALCLLGGLRALASVTGEVQTRTWDFQRMSGLSPSNLVFGKVFGAPILIWYASAWLLAVHIVAALISKGSVDILLLASLLATAVMIHALCVCASALFSKLNSAVGERSGRLQRIFVVLILLSAGGSAAALLGVLSSNTNDVGFAWYGLSRSDGFSARIFVALTTFLLAGWALVAAWRVMAVQLRAPVLPWVWPLFALFCALWFGGLLRGQGLVVQMLVWLGVFSTVMTTAAYVSALFLAPYDLVAHERYARARDKQAPAWARRYPVWLMYAAVALLAGLMAYGLSIGSVGELAVLEPGRSGAKDRRFIPVMPLLVALHFVRDAAFLVNFLITPGLKNAFAKALAIWVVSFWLLPLVLQAIGLKSVAAFLSAYTDRPLLSIASFLFQIAVLVGMLFVRWPKRR